MKNAYKNLVENPAGKRSFWSYKRLKHNIFMIFKIRVCALNSSGSGYCPVAGSVKTVMNDRVPYKSGNFLTS
jgi:hypothetical protein